MPLRLNLLHEIENERSARRRDPLKISLYILGGIIACFAALYFWNLGKLASLSHDLAKKRADFESVEPLAKAATKKVEAMQQTIKNVEAIYGGDIVDGTELVMLDGQQMPTAAFEIKVQFQTGEEIATPTPRVERKKTK